MLNIQNIYRSGLNGNILQIYLINPVILYQITIIFNYKTMFHKVIGISHYKLQEILENYLIKIKTYPDPKQKSTHLPFPRDENEKVDIVVCYINNVLVISLGKHSFHSTNPSTRKKVSSIKIHIASLSFCQSCFNSSHCLVIFVWVLPWIWELVLLFGNLS